MIAVLGTLLCVSFWLRAQTAASTGPRRIFASIGIGDYDTCPYYKECWGHLETSVNDTTDMKILLTSDFDFVAPDSMQLQDMRADKAAIVHLVEDTLHAEVHAGDDLVFMYSGHGTRSDESVTSADGTTVALTRGFIVPWNSHHIESHQFSDFIDVQYLLNALASLPARHILVILDSCNSGLAVSGAIGAPKGSGTEKELTDKIGRNIIAATSPDQEAASTTPENPRNSLFTGLLLRELRSGGADSGMRGYVSGRSLGEHVADILKDTTATTQRPVTGTFFADQFGDVLFHFKISVPEVTAIALDELRKGELDLFQQHAEQLITGFPNAPQSLWARYRLDIRKGDIADAKASVNMLSEMDEERAHEAPIGDEAGHLSNRLESIGQFMGYPKGNAQLQLDVQLKEADAWRSLEGESEIESRMMYQVPVHRRSQILVTNTAPATVHLNCLWIEPSGIFSQTDLCGYDLPAGEKRSIDIEPEARPQVVEFHFYTHPASGVVEQGIRFNTSSSFGVQTSIRVQFFQIPINASSAP